MATTPILPLLLCVAARTATASSSTSTAVEPVPLHFHDLDSSAGSNWVRGEMGLGAGVGANVLVLGGAASFAAWHSKSFSIVHAAKGARKAEFIALDAPVQIVVWEPCDRTGRELPPLPFARWSVHAIVLAAASWAELCLDEKSGAGALATSGWEFDRVLRPDGLVLSLIADADAAALLFDDVLHRRLGWHRARPHALHQARSAAANGEGAPLAPLRLLHLARRPVTPADVGGPHARRVRLPQCSLESGAQSTILSLMHSDNGDPAAHKGWRTANSSAGERGFCTLPSTAEAASSCVMDVLPSECDGLERRLARPPLATISRADANAAAAGNMTSALAMAAPSIAVWEDQTLLKCGLPMSLRGLQQEWNGQYLTVTYKHVEWNECYEQRAVNGTRMPWDPHGVCPKVMGDISPCMASCEQSNKCRSMEPRLRPAAHNLTVPRRSRRVLDAGGGSCMLASNMKLYLPHSHADVSVLGFDVGYNCGFLLVCAERGLLTMPQSWFEPLRVPDQSQDVVFQAQGLHYIPPIDAKIVQVFENLLRPLRPGGILHLSDGDGHAYGENKGRWARVLPRWAAGKGLVLVRNQKCTGHRQFLYWRPP